MAIGIFFVESVPPQNHFKHKVFSTRLLNDVTFRQYGSLEKCLLIT